MIRELYIEKRECYQYPQNNFCYHPSYPYPEYLFSEDDISKEINEVYDMLRMAFYGMELDVEHYNTAQWNPLGKFIKKGDTVLIKPNMVKNYTEQRQNECTLTHPSLVRAVIDYCLIAQAGQIILGDAPIQGANMKAILKYNHYIEILEFYKKKGVSIEFADFRNYIVTRKHGLIQPQEDAKRCKEIVKVPLGEQSFHYIEKDKKVYEICGYDDERINRNHGGSKHDYIIAAKVLGADVILNLPKPKTHRFAGITGAQKNFVGICADKESVPHFVAGSKSQGGDETNRNSIVSRAIHGSYKQYMRFNAKEHYKKAWFMYWLNRFFRIFKNKNLYLHGAWHGNDTIWKSILDLNRIILYADKNGKMCWGRQQRKILTIGDLIIAGEGDGPLSPTPKPMGMLIISTNMALFDFAVCKLFGFDYRLLPTIKNSIEDKWLMKEDIREYNMFSNLKELNGKKLYGYVFDKCYHAEPHPYWKEIL